MDTSKVTRIEVIDHSKAVEDGGGRRFSYWNEYHPDDNPQPIVTVELQDDDRTLKIFIS